MKTITGIPASAGIAIGKVFIFSNNIIDHNIVIRFQDLTPNEAFKLFKEGIKKAINNLEILMHKTQEEIGIDEAGIFEAQILMLEDEDFQTAVKDNIENNIPLNEAILEVIDYWVVKFQSMENEYFQERAGDIKDVGNQILKVLTGNETTSIPVTGERYIIAAKELTPSDTAEMPKDKVLGFATELGGSTSHVAIISKALRIPAVVGIGLSKLLEHVNVNDWTIIDGINGKVILNPDSETLEKYKMLQNKFQQEQEELNYYANLPAITKDELSIQVQANIGSINELDNALKFGAEGIGLLRTEFLYLNRNSTPSEDDLFLIFKNILIRMAKKPVILRTIDVGGDKKISYLDLPKEPNPFLGYRGSRLFSDGFLREVIITQLRAALRASVFGNLKIMFPMITTVSEIKSIMNIVDQIKSNFVQQGVHFSNSVEMGIMVEVPSTALCIEAFIPYVDFFSIGTNDLTQYTTAADRTNECVSYLVDHYHPAVLKLIKNVVDIAHSHDKWVGVCGELAGETLAAPFLIGLKIEEMSMNPSAIPCIKKKITELSYANCKKLIPRIICLSEPSEVRTFLASLE